MNGLMNLAEISQALIDPVGLAVVYGLGIVIWGWMTRNEKRSRRISPRRKSDRVSQLQNVDW